MVYVALLRGINVGGKNKIDMKLLKKTFERVGMTSIGTYINSGNIIFTDKNHAKTEIPMILNKAILEDFGLNIKVLIRSFDDIETTIKALPANWENNEDMKSDILFLWDEINTPSLIEELMIQPKIDTAKYAAGSILWKVDRKNLTKSGMMKLAGTDLYQKMTIRNVNTTRKIYDLMQSVAS